jgi:hypothetical protein
MLLATGQISYLETALTEALGRLRPSPDRLSMR